MIQRKVGVYQNVVYGDSLSPVKRLDVNLVLKTQFCISQPFWLDKNILIKYINDKIIVGNAEDYREMGLSQLFSRARQ